VCICICRPTIFATRSKKMASSTLCSQLHPINPVCKPHCPTGRIQQEMRSNDTPGQLQAQCYRLQCEESQTQLSGCCPLSRGGSRRLAILPSHTAGQVQRRHHRLLPKTPDTEAAQNRLTWCYSWCELPTCLVVCPRRVESWVHEEDVGGEVPPIKSDGGRLRHAFINYTACARDFAKTISQRMSIATVVAPTS